MGSGRGVAQYPLGAEDFLGGLMPPPGTYFQNFLHYYRSTRFNDKHGDKLFPDFKVEIMSEVVGFYRVTPIKIFGGTWAVRTLIPFHNVKVE
jgi:hypothetical protein